MKFTIHWGKQRHKQSVYMDAVLVLCPGPLPWPRVPAPPLWVDCLQLWAPFSQESPSSDGHCFSWSVIPIPGGHSQRLTDRRNKGWGGATLPCYLCS